MLLLSVSFILGRVLFSMKYMFEEQSLSITIFEANDLPSADEDTGTSDPYIRVMLLPDTKRRFETLVRKIIFIACKTKSSAVAGNVTFCHIFYSYYTQYNESSFLRHKRKAKLSHLYF